MLSKRFIIETINDQLKNISQIEHSRHRNLHSFTLNLQGDLIVLSKTRKAITKHQQHRKNGANGDGLNRTQVIYIIPNNVWQFFQ